MKLNRYQRYLMESEKNKKLFIGGRCSGKTQLAVAATLDSLSKNHTTDVVSPTQDLAKHLREKVIAKMEENNMSCITKTHLTVEHESGRMIRFWTSQGSGWVDKVRSSPSVIIDEAQEVVYESKKISYKKLKEINNLFIISQRHKMLQSLVDYEKDNWEYAIAPTTTNPEVNGSMLEEQHMERPESKYEKDFMIKLLDLSNGHTLALPKRSYPFWTATCLDCNFEHTFYTGGDMTTDAKKYIIGEALNKGCR